jgi:hypothetical protein
MHLPQGGFRLLNLRGYSNTKVAPKDMAWLRPGYVPDIRPGEYTTQLGFVVVGRQCHRRAETEQECSHETLVYCGSPLERRLNWRPRQRSRLNRPGDDNPESCLAWLRICLNREERSLELRFPNLVKGSKRSQRPTTACGNQMTILQLCVRSVERTSTLES